MRKKKIYMTTANTVDNGKVVENLGIVSSHLVAGTGFISDFVAGLSDIFGGRSGTYKRQLESLYYDAMSELSDNAVRLGANALIGVRIDMDNISGKGMSMFMITALGTAVVADFDSEQISTELPTEGISCEMIEGEVQKQLVLGELAKEDTVISTKSWEFILNNPSPEFAPGLTKRYALLAASDRYTEEMYVIFRKNFESYISLIDRDTSIKSLFPLLHDSSSYLFTRVRNILDDNNLLDIDSIRHILNDRTLGGSVYCLLTLRKPAYTSTDLTAMRQLLEEIDNLPNVGTVEVLKEGLFKGREKYICRNGHKNSPDREFCSDCGENIKGQTEDDLKAIEEFRRKCNALEKLLEGE